MTGAWMSGARVAVIAAACSSGLALAACGGGGDEAGASGGDGDQRERMQEAGLKFAECMREEGVDVPDPEPGQPGIRFRAGPGPNSDDAAFRRAEEKCRKHLEGARPELSPEEQAEFREAALEFARCMREQGLDFPDPTFESGGRVLQRYEGDSPMDDSRFREASEECRDKFPMRDGPGGGPLGSGGPPPAP